MNRRDSFLRHSALGALAALLVGLLGCTHHQQQTRLQSEEETEPDRYGVRTVRDVASVGNPEPMVVGGVGLVEGLEGTGGETPPGFYRARMEDELRKRGVKNVREFLASKDRAIVVVSAQIPPGAGKGDRIDVEVALPPGSRATSLRGGYLRDCGLYNYDFTHHLDRNYRGPQSFLIGHQVGRAAGQVLVSVGGGDDATQLRQGRIWGGGYTKIDQPFLLTMNPGQQYARVSFMVADRVNDTFQAAPHAGPGDAVAFTRDPYAVALRVPAQYRLNRPRFLRVVCLVPLRDIPNEAGGGDRKGQPDPRTYVQRLAEDLLDPAHTVTAALRLEALGAGSQSILKRGLQSKHPLVRFCAAESLAYLDCTAGAEELGRAVAGQPLLRAFALTALASLDEAPSQVALGELLQTATDDETRYGAFRALRALDEHNPAVRGELLNDSFWLHRVAPKAPPLVHLSTTRRAEVVLFGEEPFLKAPFSLLAGEFTVTAGDDDTGCVVSRIAAGCQARRPCSLKLQDVLRTMADLGALYPDVMALLQQADVTRSLTCRVRCDALPQAVSVQELVDAGRDKGQDLLPAGQDLGRTPSLFEIGVPSRWGHARGPEPRRDRADAGGQD